MIRRPLTWLLVLASLAASGCMLPQPDTPPVPPLFGRPGAPRGAAAAPAREAARDGVTPDVARDAVMKGEANGRLAMPLAPDLSAALTPGEAALPPGIVAGGPNAAASAVPLNGALAGTVAASAGGLEVGGAADATTGPLTVPAVAESTATVKPDPDTPRPASITLSWAPTAGIGAARLLPIGDASGGSAAAEGGPVMLPAGTYAVEVFFGDGWHRLAGTLSVQPGEALDVTLGFDAGGPRLERTQSQQG